MIVKGKKLQKAEKKLQNLMGLKILISECHKTVSRTTHSMTQAKNAGFFTLTRQEKIKDIYEYKNYLLENYFLTNSGSWLLTWAGIAITLSDRHGILTYNEQAINVNDNDFDFNYHNR